IFLIIFFFSSRRRHTRFSRDWSSDVCSSDLLLDGAGRQWLFYELDVKLKCFVIKVDGLFDGVALIGIDPDEDIFSKLFTKLDEAFNIFFEILTKFHLEYGKPILDILARFLERLVNTFNPDRDRCGQRFEFLSQYAHERQSKKLRVSVVKRYIKCSAGRGIFREAFDKFICKLSNLPDVASYRKASILLPDGFET